MRERRVRERVRRLAVAIASDLSARGCPFLRSLGGLDRFVQCKRTLIICSDNVRILQDGDRGTYD